MDSSSESINILTQENGAHKDSSGEIYEAPFGSTFLEKIRITCLDQVPQFDISKHQKDIEDCLDVCDFEVVGKGKFGFVFKCKGKENNEKKFAVKVMKAKFTDKKYMEYWARLVRGELYSLKKLKNPNIVEYNDHCWMDSEKVKRCYLAIKTELMDYTLLDIIRALKRPFEFVWFKRLFLDIATALVYMHDEMGMAHHDLKFINVMVTRVRSLNFEDLKEDLVSSPWKIIDLGNVHVYPGPKEQAMETQFFDGTTRYNCPSKLAKIQYPPFKSDSYAFGMLCWQAITGNENVFKQSELNWKDKDYAQKLKPAWEIIDNNIMPDLMEQGEIGPHHQVARKLIAPEEERIFVSEALELFEKEGRNWSG